MKIFISSAHNRPSGGTKYLNMFVNLFIEKGFQSYLVVPCEPTKASFLNYPAPVIDTATMLELCSKDDIIIDCWQSDALYSATKVAHARKKIFWHHGASIPIGGGYAGEKVYSRNSFYTQYWNVSRACADYIEDTYGVVSNVMPLFSPVEPKELFSHGLPYDRRNGVMALWARGATNIQMILSRGLAKTVTVVLKGYDEKDWYDYLFKHRIFVSVDQGIVSTPFKQRLKYRIFGKKSHYWKTPQSRLLGFPTPTFEAALCGCVVVGAAMGGGLEWMREDNCYLAEDLNTSSLFEQLERAVNATDIELLRTSQAAFESVSCFTKNNTWNRLSELIGL